MCSPLRHAVSYPEFSTAVRPIVQKYTVDSALPPAPFWKDAAARPEGRQITYTDLYEWGLSGRPGSAERKAKLLNALGLPPRLSKKELVEALNRLYTFEQLNELQLKILDS